MKKVLLAFAALMVVSLPLNAQAGEKIIPVTETATIDPYTANAGRLLFRFDLPEDLDGAFIDYAELLFKVDSEPPSSHCIVIGGFPVSTDWDQETVSWSNPWTNTGGDHLDTVMATCLDSRTENRLTSLDITEIVKFWVEKKIDNFGVILLDLDPAEKKLKLQETTLLPQGTQAQVRIFYTGPEVKR